MSDPRPENGRSTSSLLGDALGHVTSLVRNEIDLAKAEAKEGVKQAAVAIAMLIAALVILICALNVLTVSLVAAVAELADIGSGWATLIVGIAYLAVAWGLIAKALHDLKLKNLAPRRTAKNVQRDAVAVKESYNA